jgi:undecaprenyl-diphosphatase
VLVADGAAELLASALKALVGRRRPAVDRLGPAVSSPSFPSGHTSTSVACALVLAAYVPRLRGPLYVLAALIAFSRLYNGDHYPLDVAGGVVLGLLTARLLLGAIRRRSRPGWRPG